MKLPAKTTVTNNSINYNYAISKSLMNDRKGSSSIGIDSGNIRYYGADPNNYVYFNCNSYNSQNSSSCEKWRIIGVFDGKLKLIRSGSIGTYAWDNKNTSSGASTAYGESDWSNARLMKLMNSGFMNLEIILKLIVVYTIMLVVVIVMLEQVMVLNLVVLLLLV